eukprot:scaffold2720_cov212-Pinguiococcus_pyrenoidosus.AAC.1
MTTAPVLPLLRRRKRPKCLRLRNVCAGHIAFKRHDPQGRFCVDATNADTPATQWMPNDDFSRETSDATFGTYTDHTFGTVLHKFVDGGFDKGWWIAKSDVRKAFTNVVYSFDLAKTLAQRVGDFVAPAGPLGAHLASSRQAPPARILSASALWRLRTPDTRSRTPSFRTSDSRRRSRSR